jgi:hypothetical protein
LRHDDNIRNHEKRISKLCFWCPSRRVAQGMAPSFFVMDGHDLTMVLNEAISLPEFLRCRVRLLAEEGLVSVPFSELK